MIEKKTIVDQIEITRYGHLQIRLALLLVEYGVELDCKWHRTAIEPGGDVDLQMAAVNAHLAVMGKQPVAYEEIERIKAFATVAHTPEVIAAFREKQSKLLQQ